MDRIDAHCHFWDPARGDYRWLADGPATLDPLRRTFGPDELAAQNGGRPVIAVQAADSLAETRYLLSLAQEHPQILGVVGWVDLSRATAAQDLQDLARDPRFKGVRPMLQDLPEDDWIATRPDPRAMRRLLELGLSFDALVLTRHLAPLAHFVARWPDLPVMIDHGAKPDLRGAPTADWRAGLRQLAGHAQVWCKLSGLLTELPPAALAENLATAAGRAAVLARLRPAVAEMLELFGPARLVWGSDWPVVTLVAGHALWEELTEALLAGLTTAERLAVLGGNARTFYRIGGGND